MSKRSSTRNGPPDVAQILKEPIELMAVRLDALEKEAERRVRIVVTESKAAGDKLFATLRREWKLGMSGPVERLRSTGERRIAAIRRKVDAAGAEAIDRIAALQNAAVEGAGLASRAQLEELTREVKRVIKKVTRRSTGP